MCEAAWAEIEIFMKKSLFYRLATILMCMVMMPCAFAQKKTIVVTPENAKIFVNGSEVGTGTYTVKFNRNTDFFMLRFEAPGYLTRSVKLMKDNPNKTVSYTLYEDEAEKNSIGEESGVLANKWFDVTCREDMTEDKIWKRLMNIAVNNFEDIEIRDKDAGWIKTGWKVTRFSSQTVRTRLEIRVSFSDEEHISYKVRLTSEIKDSDCRGSNCYVKYDRLLKKYESVIQELTTSIGSNI